jgi:hypothetical protein
MLALCGDAAGGRWAYASRILAEKMRTLAPFSNLVAARAYAREPAGDAFCTTNDDCSYNKTVLYLMTPASSRTKQRKSSP